MCVASVVNLEQGSGVQVPKHISVIFEVRSCKKRHEPPLLLAVTHLRFKVPAAVSRPGLG